MSNDKLTLKVLLEKESSLSRIDSFTIFDDIPIWRIVRTAVRGELLNQVNKTVEARISPRLIGNVLISFIQLANLIFRRRKYDNLIFPHPRLFKVEGKYLERLTDPIIDYSDIGKSYIIFELWQNGLHHRPRLHSKNCIYWDFIPFSAMMISKYLGKKVIRKYNDQINGLISELSKEFEVTDKVNKIIVTKLSNFIISYKLTKPIIKVCAPKRIFLAPRVTFNYIIAIAKKLGIANYELQHGITLGPTRLYSGEYHRAIDPDFFLTFGKGNISEYFGLPKKQIINIGYAYGNYLKNLLDSGVSYNNRILVISEPRITEPLLQTILLLADQYPDWEFDFRCHPQEALNNNQKKLIEQKNNIHEVANNEESFSALNRYPVIIGENSSVLFEALFLKKKVGRINFNGLSVNMKSNIQGGFVINSLEEFRNFMDCPYTTQDNPQELYSQFNPEIVNNLK